MRDVGRKPTKVREQRPQQAALATPKNRPDEAANVLELRQLQRLAGNQAVTHFIVQREAALEPLTEAKGAPLPTPVGPSAALSKEDRHAVEMLTLGELGLVNTAFVSACKDNVAALAAEAAEEAELIAMIMDIATGFLAPGVGKFLAHRAEHIAMEVENKAFKAVVKAMSEERLAKAFESAVKVGSNVMKSNYAALSGEKEANAFLTGLEVRFQAGIQAIEGHLTNMSDLELVATAAAYDSEVANVITYRAAVHELVEKYQKQVGPIEQGYGAGGVRVGTYAYYLKNKAGKKHLALVHQLTGSEWGIAGGKDWGFKTWISKDMAPLALEKMKEYGGPKTVDEDDVAYVSVTMSQVIEDTLEGMPQAKP